MAEIKMAATATRGRFCDGSISENVQGPKLYKCTEFHTFMKRFKKYCDKTWGVPQNITELTITYLREQFMMF